MKAELIRGRLIESVVAALIYAVCRMKGIPRTPDELARISSIEKHEIGGAYRFVRRELSLNVPLTDPTQYVPKFVAVLQPTGEVQETAIKLLKTSLKSGLTSGRIPSGVASAAVYIAVALHSETPTHTGFSTLQKRPRS